MSDRAAALQQLIALSRSLGDPTRDLAILGEGNTSARIDSDTFLVKGSGRELRTADEGSFVAVSLPRVLEVLDGPDLADSEVRDALLHCKADASVELMPSVETFLHGFLLSLADTRFVGHTHPTAVNAILCSANAREAIRGRLFPDEIVCCGPAVCYIEYTDPGLVLARRLRQRVREFVEEHNIVPKVILMENHGLIAPGRSVKDVETATAMYVKTARVLLGTYALGGPHFLSQGNVDRIHTRPDEAYRKRLLGLV